MTLPLPNGMLRELAQIIIKNEFVTVLTPTTITTTATAIIKVGIDIKKMIQNGNFLTRQECTFPVETEALVVSPFEEKRGKRGVDPMAVVEVEGAVSILSVTKVSIHWHPFEIESM